MLRMVRKDLLNQRVVTMTSWGYGSGGFTLEVQHFGEGLGGGFEVKAFSWGVVVNGDEAAKAVL
jgi:hypothetical protein